MKTILQYLVQVGVSVLSFVLFTACMLFLMPFAAIGWLIGFIRKDEDNKDYLSKIGNLLLDGYAACWNGLKFKKKRD